MPILLKLFQKIQEKGTLQYSFYEAIITLLPQLVKDRKRRKSGATSFDERTQLLGTGCGNIGREGAR